MLLNFPDQHQRTKKKTGTIEHLPKWQLWKFGIDTDGFSDFGMQFTTILEVVMIALNVNGF